MSSTILASFSGALQASLSVLLTIFYGVIGCQYDLIDNASAKKFSQVSVKLFLPFLLITKVGEELHPSKIARYGLVLVWAVLYNVISILIGELGVRLLKLPQWVTPAVTFNNTTSLPLLLVQSLEKTGLLAELLGKGESASEAVNRAQSYFLVCAVVSNCLTFAVGPRLLGGDHEDDKDEEGDVQDQGKPDEDATADVHQVDGNANGQEEQQQQQPNETTSLLPDRLNELENQTFLVAHKTTFHFLQRAHMDSRRLSPKMRSFLSTVGSFFNSSLIGALIGAVVGLTPALHRAFFADSTDGGIFTAWLTASLKNTGDLFVTSQVILVGVKLSSSLRKMKRGDGDSGHMPWSAACFVFVVRYVFWSVVSILVIYGLAQAGKLGGDDAMLWFSMMLMPTGPPAMGLIPMADVSDKRESVKMSVAKLLTSMYGLSPVLAFVVVGALKASQQVLDA